MSAKPKYNFRDLFGSDYFEISPYERLLRWLKLVPSDSEGFHAPLFGQLKLLEAESNGKNHGRVVFEFTNPSYWENFSGNLHGGAHATIHDVVTSFAIVPCSRKDFWFDSGVTRTLNCTYLRPAPAGEPLIIEAETVAVGQRLALIRGVIKRKKDGAVVSTCEHNKVNTSNGAKL